MENIEDRFTEGFEAGVKIGLQCGNSLGRADALIETNERLLKSLDWIKTDRRGETPAPF